MKQLRILVFSAGFGNGHYKAAEAVIAAIKAKEPSAEITHLDFGDFLSKRFNAMAKNLYIEMIKHTPKLWGKFYDTTAKFHPDSRIQRFLKQLGRKEFLKFIQDLSPDMIVCTYPTVSSILAQLRSEQILQVPLVTVITDYTAHSHWIHPGVDRYMVACKEVKEILLSWGIREQSILVTGIPVNPKFELKTERVNLINKLGLNPDIPIFLLMGGDYGGVKTTKRICTKLSNSEVPIQSIVVCGKNSKLYKSLADVSGQSPNPMIRLGYVHNLEELMTVSNLIITKAGGLTVTEALKKQLPLLIYKAIPGQEEANAEFILRSGAGQTANSEKELMDFINYYLNNPRVIERMRVRAAVAVPSQSAEKTVNEMFELLLESQASRIS
ncbi:UDP-N-acetylglucosamine--LPS N-acetylglucosamine transferase [Desulfosporosinus orientis]|uniref:UDP-N-acetylglucosamine--LPS N-acetylglucosamine transferase n=1 Tax=Desulfosporosinus orientis TaxID=1563 RepID=UPI0005A8584D|nr:UDP-N-acetylglucosamine--LPS N-acetylglucosamine transferase [Desulfosporosinus orientis]